MFIALSVVILTGCLSQVPFPATYLTTKQHYMQSAHHWDVLAADVAEQIDKYNFYLESKPLYLVNPLEKKNCPNSIGEYSCISPFEKAFYKLLITQLTQLTQRGRILRQFKEDALTIDYETQVVLHHNKRRSAWNLPGTFSLLSSGIVVVRKIIEDGLSIGEFNALTMGAGIIADVTKGAIVDGIPNTELIVTVTLSSGDDIVMGITNIYYFNEQNRSHYESPSMVTVEIVDE